MRMKLLLLGLCSIALHGCATQPDKQNSKPIIEHRVMHIEPSVPLHFAANDLAIKLGIDSVEWNPHLNPWEIRTIRKRDLSLDTMSKQAAFTSLFEEMGLLAYYDEKYNRVRVEPFSVDSSKYVIFEPQNQALKLARQKVELRKNTPTRGERGTFYSAPHQFSYRSSINAWLGQDGFKDVIWELTSQELAGRLNEKPLKDQSYSASDSLEAVYHLAQQVAQGRNDLKFFVTIDAIQNTVIVHQFGLLAEIQAFAVNKGLLLDNINRLVSRYGYVAKFDGAPRQKVNTAYQIGVTDRIDQAVNRLVQPYGLKATFVPSAKTVFIED